MKPTKRKAFNFLRSYFDVLNELQNDADKFNFLMSIVNKQFLNEDPKDLSFIVKLCYESQRHQIEKSVNGWVRVSKTDVVGNPTLYPPSNPMSDPQEVEEEEEVKEEVKEVVCIEKENQITEEHFIKRWKDARLHYDKQPTLFKKLISIEKVGINELKKDYNIKEFDRAIQGLFQQNTFPVTRLRPTHFLKRENFETYLTCFTTKEKLFDNNKYKKVDRI